MSQSYTNIAFGNSTTPFSNSTTPFSNIAFTNIGVAHTNISAGHTNVTAAHTNISSAHTNIGASHTDQPTVDCYGYTGNALISIPSDCYLGNCATTFYSPCNDATLAGANSCLIYTNSNCTGAYTAASYIQFCDVGGSSYNATFGSGNDIVAMVQPPC